MNIALFSDSYFPTKSGVVTVVEQLRIQLANLGHKVVLVTVSSGTGEESYDPLVFRTRAVPFGAGTDQFYALPNIKDIILFLENHDIDIIHCHTEFNIGLAAIRVGKILKIPTICTTHTMWEDFYKYYLPFAKLIPVHAIRMWQVLFYRRFRALINVSTKARKYFKQSFMLPSMPAVTIPNAIDKKKFISKVMEKDEKITLRQKYGLQEKDKILLFVGRVAEEKRIIELLKICENVLADNNEYKALIVGDGPAYTIASNAAKESCVAEKIIFTGYIQWEKVFQFYEIADIFITASLSEMHSMTVLEASLASLPVVTRYDGSYLDTVIHGQNGYLGKTDEDMAALLLSLMKDEKKTKEFGKQSLEMSKKFTIESHIQKTVSVYEAVIQSYPERPTEEQFSQLQENSIIKF